MADATYPRPEEVTVSWSDVEAMRADPNVIVVLTFKQHDGDNFVVQYWNKSRGMLPPWVKIAA